MKQSAWNIPLDTIVQEQLVPLVKNFSLYIFSQLNTIISNAFHFLISFFIMLVTIFFTLRDGTSFGQFLISLSPLETKEELRIFRIFQDVGRAVLYGNAVSGLTQGILGGIGFWLFGIPSPIFWGAIMAFLALIPMLGPYLIFLPAAIYIGATKGLGIVVMFLLYNMLVVSSVDNLIKSQFISGRVNVHPLLIFLSILGGLITFGILGILYGPLIIVIMITLINMYFEMPREE